MPVYHKSTAAKTAALPKLQYNRKSYEQMAALADRSSSGRNTYIISDVKFYKGKDGDNRVRVLPPTWKDPEHWGYDMYLHYGVGSDNDAFLCRSKHNHGDGRCPVCEMLNDASTDEERQQLKPKHRIGVYLISREKQEDGVLFWAMPFNLDRDFIAAAMDKFTREYFPPDDVQAGYDHVFTRTGSGDRTRYSSVQISRTASPLHTDPTTMAAWVQYVVDKPIPSIMKFYEYDFIKKLLIGGEAEPEPTPITSKAMPAATGLKGIDITADVPDLSKSKPIVEAAGAEEILPASREEVHQLSFDAAASLAAAIEVDLGNIGSEEELREAICTKLGLPIPAQVGEKSPADLLREKFLKLKK